MWNSVSCSNLGSLRFLVCLCVAPNLNGVLQMHHDLDPQHRFPATRGARGAFLSADRKPCALRTYQYSLPQNRISVPLEGAFGADRTEGNACH
ncbi:hypothetical protein C8J57DRAFT_1314799 [Mycena rebaudengoi]|nr:hypothetical protein C8J57DRAFT_1314799 [Mycena rebaudengoi]